MSLPDDVGVPRNDAIGLVATYFTAARAELLQRMVLREGALTLFLGATAALFSFATNDTGGRRWALFLIPFLGLGTASINLQHTTTIRSISRYLATEFQNEVARLTTRAPIHWDASRSRLVGLGATSRWRASASLLLIVGPEIAATWLAYRGVGPGTSAVVALALSVLAVALSLMLVIRGFSARPWPEPEPEFTPVAAPSPRMPEDTPASP